MICLQPDMSDDEIAEAMDEIGLALFARGKTAAEVKKHLTREANRVADEMRNEQFQFTR